MIFHSLQVAQITIIESTWPENLLPIQSRVFPNDLSHAKIQSNCNGIVKTIQTAVDRVNGLLWLLDNGSKYCTPKIIVFDLLRNNNEVIIIDNFKIIEFRSLLFVFFLWYFNLYSQNNRNFGPQVHRYVFDELSSDSLKSIQLYSSEPNEAIDNAIVQLNPMAKTGAIILLNKSKYLIQYSLLENRPRKLSLIIRTKHFKRLYDVIIPAEITLTNDNELLIKDYANGLWLADLKQIQRSLREEDIDLFIEVKYLGSLLGASNALTTPTVGDEANQHYLYYYLPRDGAIVRWNFR